MMLYLSMSMCVCVYVFGNFSAYSLKNNIMKLSGTTVLNFCVLRSTLSYAK